MTGIIREAPPAVGLRRKVRGCFRWRGVWFDVDILPSVVHHHTMRHRGRQ